MRGCYKNVGKYKPNKPTGLGLAIADMHRERTYMEPAFNPRLRHISCHLGSYFVTRLGLSTRGYATLVVPFLVTYRLASVSLHYPLHDVSDIIRPLTGVNEGDGVEIFCTLAKYKNPSSSWWDSNPPPTTRGTEISLSHEAGCYNTVNPGIAFLAKTV